MSNRLHTLSGHKTRGIKKVNGRFKPNGSSAITNTADSTVFGRGFSVARTGTGQFTLTIQDRYELLLHATLTLWSSTIVGGGVFRVVSVTYNEATTVVVIEHQAETAGALAVADIASAAGNFVSFELIFRDAKVQRA